MPVKQPTSTGRTAKPGRTDRRHLRHQATKQEILDTAWRMVRADGLASLSMSALARSVGMEPQSLYTYYASKFSVYDAMFAQGNRELLSRMRAAERPEEPRGMLRLQARIMVEFSTEDPARHLLLFERTIPNFEPSAESYSLAIEVVETARAVQAAAGMSGDSEFDLWTALVGGLAAQQVANEPGGDRWSRLIDEAVDMYADHVFTQPRPAPGK